MVRLDPRLQELGLAPMWVERKRDAAGAAASSPDAILDAGGDPLPVVVSGARAPAPALRAAQSPVLSAELLAESSAASSAASSAVADAAPGREALARDTGDTTIPVAALDWDALSERVTHCTACRLCEKRTQTVFGVGDRQAEWMLIGEAPGENEDKQGEPFVGQAGKLLDNMLQALALQRGHNVYIANVIKCRPPGNRNPEPDEVARCEPYLQRQVALVRPKLIVAMGRFAVQSLLKTTGSIASLRGRVHEYEGVPVVVTYHPAYLLRSLPDKAKAWTDLCLAQTTYQQLKG